MSKVKPTAPESPPDVDRLGEALRRQRDSVIPVVEDGRTWNPAKTPYYVDGVRVSREEYVARQREERKQALRDELVAIVAADQSVPPNPPADPATTKE